MQAEKAQLRNLSGWPDRPDPVFDGIIRPLQYSNSLLLDIIESYRREVGELERRLEEKEGE
jgi:hypothetical protein